MKLQLVIFRTAMLAKIKGFDIECNNAISTKTKDILFSTISTNNSQWANASIEEHPDLIALPTQALLKKWLRETHNISIHVDDYTSKGKVMYDYSIGLLGSQDDNPVGEFTSYESALEEALQVALNMIKCNT